MGRWRAYRAYSPHPIYRRLTVVPQSSILQSMENEVPDDIIRGSDAARLLGIWPSEINRLIREGRINRYLVGGHPFVSLAEVQEVVTVMQRRSARQQ